MLIVESKMRKNNAQNQNTTMVQLQNIIEQNVHITKRV